MSIISNTRMISTQCEIIGQKIEALKALQKLITKDMSGLDHLLAPQIDSICHANNEIKLAHENMIQMIGV